MSEEEIEEGYVDMITKLRGRKGRRFTTSWGPEGFTKCRHPLSIMVCQPVCEILAYISNFGGVGDG